jgi:hypothetical protein
MDPEFQKLMKPEDIISFLYFSCFFFLHAVSAAEPASIVV